MSLLTDTQMSNIRALGETGMTVDVTITRMTTALGSKWDVA